MKPLRVLSLFSGIGGLDIAAEWAGMQVVGQVEIDDYCQRVLARHWPSVNRVADVREVWGDAFGAVDVIVGGFPCQPFSVAGKQRGAADDRHLWPEMRRIIQVYQPAWIVGENVPGLIRLGLDAVFADLAADGYEATAVVLPAAATGAPHLRERVFIVGHSNSQRRGSRRNTEQHPLARREVHQHGTGSPVPCAVGLADSDSLRQHAPKAGRRKVRNEDAWRHDAERRSTNVSNANSSRLSQRRERRARQPLTQLAGVPDRETQPRLGRATDGLSGWLDSLRWPAGPGQEQHEWEAPRTTQERIPHRAARLKALGNAVVPAQAYPIFAAIAAVEAGLADDEGVA